LKYCVKIVEELFKRSIERINVRVNSKDKKYISISIYFSLPDEHRLRSHIQFSRKLFIGENVTISRFCTSKTNGCVPNVNDDASLLDMYSIDVKSI